MHDVVIVGGGPAGATAAYLLKLQGLDVVVVDKSTFPRKKLCGGLITYKTLQLLRRVYGDTLESLQGKQIIEYVSTSYEIRFGEKLFASGKANPPFVLVDCIVYDNYLLDRAKDIGATVIEGDRVIHVDPSNQQVLTSSGKVFQARFILGVDGVNSIVRNSLPEGIFSQNRWKSNLTAGLEVFIPRSDIETEIKIPVIYFGLVNWDMHGFSRIEKKWLLVSVHLDGTIKVRRNPLKLYFLHLGTRRNLCPNRLGTLFHMEISCPRRLPVPSCYWATQPALLIPF